MLHNTELIQFMTGASQVAPVVKRPLASAGDISDVGLIPGLTRSPGGGHGIPLQYSCLENPVDRGAWWIIAHGVAKSQTRLKQLSMHACTLHISSMNKETIYSLVVLLSQSGTSQWLRV